MTIPGNPTLEAAPYGAQPVLIVSGAQGGPYAVLDQGNGIPVSGSDGATARVVRTDQSGNVGLAGSGSLTGDASATNPAMISVAGAAQTTRGLAVGNQVFNGTSWDRQRSNQELTVLPSAARTATVSSADQVNYNGKRLLLTVDVSLVGTGSITPSLQVKDPVSGNYATVWTAAAPIIANGTFTYYFADGASGGAATERLAFGLPSRTFRVVITHNNANTITYSVGANVGV